MPEKKTVPSLRFAGFDDAWEQRIVREIATVTTGGTPNTEVNSYWYPKQVAWLSSGEVHKKYIYTTDNMISGDGLLHSSATWVKANSVLIALAGQGKTRGTVAINRIPLTTNQSIAAMSFDPEVVSEFVLFNLESRYRELRMMSTGDGSRGGLNKTIVSDIVIPYTSIEEQKLIGDTLEHFDHLISLHQRKYDVLVRTKKAMLQKMFPRDGAKVPEIRFAGFTGAWEQRKLSEVFTSYTDPVEIPHTGYERLGIRSYAKGTFHSYVPAGQELQTAKMHRVAADKFIVNITFGWEHAVAVTDENDAGKLVSHRFPQFTLSEELDSKFLKYIILDENFRHHLWLASPGGAGRNRVLDIDEMLEYKIRIPSIPEQKRIAETLINLDTLITLHRRKYEKLKHLKQSLLEKMFV